MDTKAKTELEKEAALFLSKLPVEDQREALDYLVKLAEFEKFCSIGEANVEHR